MSKKNLKHVQAHTEKKGGKLIAIASTESEDRIGDSLKAEDWNLKNFKKNPVLQAGHDYKPQYTIGVAKDIHIDKQKRLVFEPVFHTFTQLARDLKEMYLGGVLKAWSVGYIPKSEDEEDEEEKDGKKKVKTFNELLEVSAVAVPANAEALTTVEKGIEKADKLEDKTIKDIEDWTKKCEGEECKTSEKEEIVEKPYPNEHSCRLKDPGKYDTCRRTSRTSDGKKYSILTCRRKDDHSKWEEQGYRYSKDTWTESSARSHCKAHKGIKFEPATGKEEEKQTYSCECLDCRYKVTSDKHCVDIKCPKCGGKMRRVERPGQGREMGEQVTKRWNPSLSKVFDIEKVESKPATFEYEIYTKFLDCKIKDVFLNNYLIPSPLLGTYLAGFKELMNRFELVDTRSFADDGGEVPPVYEVIKLNSEKSDDFLIAGMNFYKSNGENALIIKFSPTWSGLDVTIINNSAKKEVNKSLLGDIHKWVREYNFLRGEKFAISGEFLPKSEKTWDDVILEKETKGLIMKSIKVLNKEKDELRSRGLLFMGEPGTGKTYSGKVIMKEADSTFIWVSSKDFERMSSGSLLGLSFKLARDLAPTVLFIEDIDSWLRGSAIDTLKIEMDGIRENKGIVTILTTNFPENLPKALLDRPGRFHDVLNFELPNSSVRREMITKWTDKIETKTLDDTVEKTKGFSGAYIRELIDYAVMIAKNEEISMDKALAVSLKKLQKQRELIGEIEKEKERTKTIKGMIEKAIDASQKEGRVISGKNKRIITDAVMASKEAVTALEKLLEATESTKPDVDKEPKKVQTPERLKGGDDDKSRTSRRTRKIVTSDVVVDKVAQRVLKVLVANASATLRKNKVSRKKK